MYMKSKTLRIAGSRTLGPLDENAAMNGAGLTGMSVFTGEICATGFLYRER